MALLSAFLQSMRFVVGEPLDASGWIPTSEIAWGTHWCYRLIAEAGTIGGATFVAAGIARERGQVGGVLGGLAIAAIVGLAAYVTYVLQIPLYMDEPWYQDYITIVLPLVSPVAGYFVGTIAAEVSTSKQSGLAGIPRAHFVWIWLPMWLYALLLIAPALRFAEMAFFGHFSYPYFFISVVVWLLFGAPALIGIGLLSGDIKPEWPSWIRQLAGSGVLIGHLTAVSLLLAGWTAFWA